MSKTDVLTHCEGQFKEINRRLETQLTRIAQLQQQIDLHHKEIVETHRELESVHGLLRQLLASIT